MTTLLHSLIRCYCSHIPIEFGKGRLQKIGRKYLYGKTLEVSTRHCGIKVEITLPEDAGREVIFYRRTYETGTTEAFAHLLRPNDVFFDIGANIGWYSLLASKLASEGEVHAFEPLPFIFNKLIRNWKINGFQNKVYFNNIALGDNEDSEATMYTFQGLYHSHSSLSTFDRSDYKAVTVPMTTLDQYITDNDIQRIDLIKMDTEGAELDILKGGVELLKRNVPPILVIELNTKTSASFGHTPTDVLDLLLLHNDYRFYRINRAWGKLKPMASTGDYRNGDNAICVPVQREHIRL
ncbi:MAG: FkbM family methyltransferase [Chlorobi bacterium]|nr:FkbM family methyltransferase [Chlorobiota bacterium]